MTYTQGIQEGLARDWYSTGALKAESYYVQGTLHGASKEYDKSGHLVVESHYEYGIPLWTRRLGPDGTVIESEELDPQSDTAQLLDRLRMENGW